MGDTSGGIDGLQSAGRSNRTARKCAKTLRLGGPSPPAGVVRAAA